jgi:hypothetical protein
MRHKEKGYIALGPERKCLKPKSFQANAAAINRAE